MFENYQNGWASRFYFDGHFRKEATKILPGEYYVTTNDMVLVTVLGSCVAACIRDRRKEIGGMNHFMLPEYIQDDVELFSSSARYGIYAMEVLINHLMMLGAHRDDLEAKVFGGGNVINSLSKTNIGQRNAHFVLKFLRTERIPIAAQDLTDVYARKVYYFPKTGKVMVKKLHSLRNETIFEREKNYGQRLRRVKPGEIELFT